MTSTQGTAFGPQFRCNTWCLHLEHRNPQRRFSLPSYHWRPQGGAGCYRKDTWHQHRVLCTAQYLSGSFLFLNCGPCFFNSVLLRGSPNGPSYMTSFLYRFPRSSWLEHICSAWKRPTSHTQQPLLHPQESYNRRLRYFTKVPAHHSVWGPH